MTNAKHKPFCPPAARDIRQAIEVYLSYAYGDDTPDSVQRFIPPDGFDPAAWLMSDLVERTPPDAPMESVRSFALRLGNSNYPHMKLRLSRPPKEGGFVFSIDSHDAFLAADADSPDGEALKQLKSHNAEVAKRISKAWDAAGLSTQQDYLRRKLRQAKRQKPKMPEKKNTR
ncbi:MAG: hypothetical protein SVT52_04330 [Planctomycetota bacterium]|nr:hypothetical protein [Planctomycetota bacterium]